MDYERVGLFDTPIDHINVNDVKLAPASKTDLDEFGRRWHYTNSGGNMTWRYGAWVNNNLIGVIGFNLPTRSVCESVFGAEYFDTIVHMGRLICDESAPKNIESKIISESLRAIKKDVPQFQAVITYAAPHAGHIGTVYQATNALYIGLGGDTRLYIDKENKQRSTYQHGKNISATMAQEMGWSVSKIPQKHRYLYLLGTSKNKKYWRKKLKYQVLPYPKLDERTQP